MAGKYRPLMILGSGSDVGKSLVVAGLCRLFRQEGIRVVPFKAQNMALNSFITPEGGEMGRAQVVQALAAGLAPHVDMNPILLKPAAQVGSQVIVHGRVWGNFTTQEYHRAQPRLIRRVMASFRRLKQAYDLVILEGAGSAVELNLKKRDLVNFAMARRAGAAALLVADIDRGGVFAATIGSWHLLTPAERRLLAGFIINKFRGDPELFRDGADIIARRTGRPVLGILPYLPDLALPEEDSVALERKGKAVPGPEAFTLRIGVVKLPHISNYTDFDPLEHEPGVLLRYLDHRDTLEDWDLLILPGTKNTIHDLKYLKETGLAAQLRIHARRGGRVAGICGGYQMLGLEVRDPLGLEGPPRAEAGLGLLPVVTTMAGEKTTTQVKAKALEALGLGGGEVFPAYEIHLGETEPLGPGSPAFLILERHGREAATPEGWVSPDGRVFGTYLHGLFDHDGFRRRFLGNLAPGGGIPASGSLSFQTFLEVQLDNLAAEFRRHLDLPRLFDLIRP
ncbi:MAG: cobyric acid synthase [Deltaproteobacteria bacterium]|nr:cobyric acid synthase [Deltaproteobacteria bacterium]